MTRRDTDAQPHNEDTTLGGINMQWSAPAYYRLRCLEVAVKTFDPDIQIDVLDLMGTAQALMLYVQSGEVPVLKLEDAMTERDKKEFERRVQDMLAPKPPPMFSQDRHDPKEYK